MAGTKAGGLKASATNKAKYGEDFYKRQGAKGGRLGHTGGFASNPTLAKLAGAMGGRRSKRGSAVQYEAYKDGKLVSRGDAQKIAVVCDCSTATVLRYAREGGDFYGFTIKRVSE